MWNPPWAISLGFILTIDNKPYIAMFFNMGERASSNVFKVGERVKTDETLQDIAEFTP